MMFIGWTIEVLLLTVFTAPIRWVLNRSTANIDSK